MIFVDPDHKRLLVIANQEAAKQNIGDYVEITGELDKYGKTLQIAALKLIEKGRAMCDVPKNRSKGADQTPREQEELKSLSH